VLDGCGGEISEQLDPVYLVTFVGDDLLLPLRTTVLQRTLVSSVAASEIRISELGPRGTALGASTLVLGAALQHPAPSNGTG
jgi:hypothetical protein